MSLHTAFAPQSITRDVRVSILARVPVLIAAGALIGAIILMASAMLRLLPDGFAVSLNGLSAALLLACVALAFEHSAKDAGRMIRDTSAFIRRMRLICLSAAFALGFLIPVLISIIPRP